MTLGIILIALGLVFLLQTLGFLSWDAWTWLWQLWPLALIVGGLSVLMRGSPARLPMLVAATLVGGGLLTAFYNRPGAQGSLENIAEPLQNAPRGEVVLSAGVGKLEVSALNSSANLIEGRIQLLPGERLERDVERDGDRLSVRLEAKGRTSSGIGPGRSEGWKLGLAPNVSLRLRISTGVGESLVRLQGLQIDDLKVDTGVGSTRVELPSKGVFSANIDGGVGEIVVVVPQELGLRLQADAGLGGVRVPNGLIKQGEHTYVSPDYQSAVNKVDLKVDGGVGSIQVRR